MEPFKKYVTCSDIFHSFHMCHTLYYIPCIIHQK